ncbi:MAG: hypothetical protein ACR2FY_23400 [Pirellulaceae bacterium]
MKATVLYHALLLVIVSLTVGAEPVHESALMKARREYLDSLFKAADDFDIVSAKIHAAYLARLKALEQDAKRSGDLAAAAKVAQELQAKEGEGPPSFSGKTLKTRSLILAKLKGTWLVKFSNNTSHPRQIQSDGSVNGAEGKVNIENDEITIVYAEVIERITIAEKKIVVEHFNPKSSYSPTETASVVGIGTPKPE